MTFIIYILRNFDNDPSPEWIRSLTILFILLALLLVGLVAGLSSEGNEISTDNNHYRNYFALLGLRFGRWLPLPSVVGITLKFYATVGSGSTSWGVWGTSGVQYQKLVLLLSLQNSATGLIVDEFDSDELTAARQNAQELAERFGVPVHEYLVPQRTHRH